jgi:hypothetical protein
MRTETKLIKTELGLINLAEQLGNVSQACRMMGYSRDIFFQKNLDPFLLLLYSKQIKDRRAFYSLVDTSSVPGS